MLFMRLALTIQMPPILLYPKLKPMHHGRVSMISMIRWRDRVEKRGSILMIDDLMSRELLFAPRQHEPGLSRVPRGHHRDFSEMTDMKIKRPPRAGDYATARRYVISRALHRFLAHLYYRLLRANMGRFALSLRSC